MTWPFCQRENPHRRFCCFQISDESAHLREDYHLPYTNFIPACGVISGIIINSQNIHAKIHLQPSFERA
jgi:hypothetical protein